MVKSRLKKVSVPKRNVSPDKLDLRDRPYSPVVSLAPPPSLKPKIKLPVLNQQDTSACTGFALASVVHHLRKRRDYGRNTAIEQVSPFMLYSMARRYDEFPGASEDTGSSLRGAMKGWYKHGVCRAELWKVLDMPPSTTKPEADWWQDAALRPLGAYYRVDTRSVTDMHVALNEVGILYASAICHGGWMKDDGPKPRGDYWTIPMVDALPDDGGHAFAIVGYDSRGFLIQNSWGTSWGSGGLARLTYEDWTQNAMDCWVAQVGVVTEQHKEIAASISLRVEAGKVRISSDQVLRAREIAPFVVNMENNGRLSSNGTFRTNESDLEALVNLHMAAARKTWGVGPSEAIDVAIYAHGGLTSEDAAATTAARWIPALYEAKIFPVFFMWETDLFSTLKNRFEDIVTGLDRPTAGLGDMLKRMWNQRLERTLAPLGSVIWGEMKQNAQSISRSKESGGLQLYRKSLGSPYFKKNLVRLHLIGHSAGSIVHSYLAKQLADLGWSFESMNFLAPAVTVKTFQETALPRIADGTVKQFRTFHLTDDAEQKDPTCRPILGYGRSLLYLVSESFENGVRTPLLGMEKHYSSEIAKLGLANMQAFTAPGTASASSTHGGFDDDEATLRSVISLIRYGQT